jgi:hypothetical protein
MTYLMSGVAVKCVQENVMSDTERRSGRALASVKSFELDALVGLTALRVHSKDDFQANSMCHQKHRVDREIDVAMLKF